MASCDQVPGVEGFRAWVSEYAPHEVVGRVADWVECPLARFFSAYYGMPCEVSRFFYRLVPDVGRAGLPAVLWVPEEKHELPAWAVALCHDLDHAYAFRGHRLVPSLPVTQAQVVKVLDEIQG